MRRLVRIASAFAKVDDKISPSESKENILKLKTSTWLKKKGDILASYGLEVLWYNDKKCFLKSFFKFKNKLKLYLFYFLKFIFDNKTIKKHEKII